MKSYTNNTLGLTCNVLVPASAEEYDKLAGKEGAVVDDANQYIILHSLNTKLRSDFLDAVEKETGIERKVDQARTDAQPEKKDGTKTPVYEKEALYFKRVIAESGRAIESFKDLLQTVADKTPFDNSESKSSGSIGKEYKNAASDMLDKLKDEPDRVSAIVAKLEGSNPGLSIEIDADTNLPTIDGLARAIKVNADRKRKEDLAEMMA